MTLPARRPATDADIEAVWYLVAPNLVEAYNEEAGQLKPMIVCLYLDDQPGQFTAVRVVPDRIVEMLFAEDCSGTQRTNFVRRMVDPPPDLAALLPNAAPDIAVVVSEAWMLSTKAIDDEEVAAIRRAGISDHPERTETIIFIFHTADRTVSGTCPIDAVTRKARLGKLLLDHDLRT